MPLADIDGKRLLQDLCSSDSLLLFIEWHERPLFKIPVHVSSPCEDKNDTHFNRFSDTTQAPHRACSWWLGNIT